MRISKGRIICTIAAFFAVLTAFNMVMNYLLIPYSFTRMKVHYLETETCDDLILGSSHAESMNVMRNENMCALLNEKFDGKYSVYNMGISGHTIRR